MKRLQKWLFPVLTCLIIIGAAALPARLSQARDARQFSQIHAEELTADSLSLRESPVLTDRMALFAGQYSAEHPVLSYELPMEEEELRITLTLDIRHKLEESGIFPRNFFQEFEEDPLIFTQILLWDPEKKSVFREPVAFWRVEWRYFEPKHSKRLSLVVDGKTLTPVSLYVSDTNLAQWLPYKMNNLQNLAERYFSLLDWEPGRDIGDPREVKTAGQRALYYSMADADILFALFHMPTSLTIQPELIEEVTDAGGNVSASR